MKINWKQVAKAQFKAKNNAMDLLNQALKRLKKFKKAGE